ncbi:MAG TPA: cyclic pyranopterin monophosphate synthase MoaC [Myxococcaceae bacterium]|nr:cyclic pyranopterin monophosphate synthase MoaC [Myxococcaceae bacterium]
MSELTHLDTRGEARMVDVGEKPRTHRRAVAEAYLRASEEVVALLRTGSAPKGDVLATARVAGIMAAKRTPELIPLCHGVALTRVSVDLEVQANGVRIVAAAEAQDRTGVEMEAMTAASIAALTLYDMLKSLDKGLVVERLALVEKEGGRSGHWRRGAP